MPQSDEPGPSAQAPPRVALVTGTLAEPALHGVADQLRRDGLADPVVIVLKIQVAALMTADWVARKLALPADLAGGAGACQRVILPGYCRGDVALVQQQVGLPVELGPANLHDLPTYFGRPRTAGDDYGAHDIQIIAEINHAPNLSLDQIIAKSISLRDQGADVIDIGCDPRADRTAWQGVAEAVRELCDRGLRVSIDSFHPREIEAAVDAGAELVLSVNRDNLDDVCRIAGAEYVAIPDTPDDLASLDRTIDALDKHDIRYRIDPILEPIGCGFARSLGRYLEARRRWPNAAMMMGVGNLTELTEVDTAGVNMLLLGFCQELGIHSVLTTQVINWASSAVRELDVARRLARFAATRQTPPKHVDSSLLLLRDARLHRESAEALAQLAQRLTDKNVRLFIDQLGKLHAMHKSAHAVGDDPFELFKALGIDDASHAFYLGYEMAKAATAATLDKQYVQDQPLDWGLLTRQEVSHVDRHRGPQPERP